MENNKVFVAADPEVVVVNAEGVPVPCVGILPGSKKEPFSNEFGEIMEDNVLAEFTINPQNTAEDFSQAFDDQITALKEMLKPHGLGIAFKSSVHFKPEELTSKQAREAGCDPDYNAWAALNPTVRLGNTTLRTAAGHIHMDIPTADRHPRNRQRVAKVCDLLIGVPLTLVSNDTERRKLYGGAGAHRPKLYGIEYRVPDNSWVENPELRRWVFNVVQIISNEYEYYSQYADQYKEKILKAINEDDLEAARYLYQMICPISLPHSIQLRA